MQIQQKGNKVSGSFMAAKWGSLEGKVTGRTLKFDYRKFNFRGEVEIEMSADGKRIYGAKTEDGYPWFGLKPADFTHQITPKAGEIVQGVAVNGMLYYLRMPDGWIEGQETDVVVLLHGSNWTTAGMVFITNENWPEIGKKFAIVGIQGESWANWSELDDLRFNYTYVNWVGRSTYGGFPGTDRESPYLVAEVLDEMKKLYSFDRIFLGGHSQGGYLTYVMHMNFPEKLAGTFPVAGGLIFQAEPDAFDDKKLMAAQRDTPMVIVHGKSDNVVDFGMGQAAHNSFMKHGFPKVRLISPNMGHPYDFLPIDQAIHYLDMLTTKDKDQLAAFANEQVELKNWRDVGNSIARAKEIKAGPLFSPIWRQYEEAAKKDAAKLLKDIERNKDSKWVDDYLDYAAEFSNADAARAIVEAYAKLRDEQSEPADELYKTANEAFRGGDRAKGFELYQQIADKYYASIHYRSVRDSLKRNR
jgi:predicted esterase